jgi:ethanolamine utilization protein EutN
VILGKVSGTVVSTISHPLFDSRRLLMCDLLDAGGADTGKYLICVDSVEAGPGDVVLILDEGNGARQVLAWKDGPIRSVIVGIVDELIVDDVVLDVTGG